MFIADLLDFRPIGLGRDDHPAGTLNGLCNERGNTIFTQFFDLDPQLSGAFEAEFFGRHVATFVPPIGLVDVTDVGDWQTALGVHRGHAAQAGATDRGTVIAIPAPNNDGLVGLSLRGPVVAHEADVGIVRL